MATDVEGSDTDEHERPAPPKRPRTRLVNNDSFRESEQSRRKEDSSAEAGTSENDEIEVRTRERLKKWQACQVARGFVDNTINRVLENYVLAPPSSYPFDENRFPLYRGDEMEDTAVMMAIQNHGLVQSTAFAPRSRVFREEDGDSWTGEEPRGVECSCLPDCEHDDESFADASTATSAGTLKSLKTNEVRQVEEKNGSGEKIYDGDQQQDFLERAIAEAIKKKGLSVLSVDYG